MTAHRMMPGSHERPGGPECETPTPAVLGEWLLHTYGPDRDILAQGLKLASEAGEVCDAIGKRADRRPPPPEGWDDRLRDEIADVVLSAMVIAHTEGFDLDATLASKWQRVQAKYESQPSLSAASLRCVCGHAMGDHKLGQPDGCWECSCVSYRDGLPDAPTEREG